MTCFFASTYKSYIHSYQVTNGSVSSCRQKKIIGQTLWLTRDEAHCLKLSTVCEEYDNDERRTDEWPKIIENGWQKENRKRLLDSILGESTHYLSEECKERYSKLISKNNIRPRGRLFSPSSRHKGSLCALTFIVIMKGKKIRTLHSSQVHSRVGEKRINICRCKDWKVPRMGRLHR